MAESILTQFRRNALRFGDQPCFHFKKGGRWSVLTWVDAEELVRRYALGFSALGLTKGKRAALLSQTRVEWTLLDLGLLASQAVTVPLYATLSPDQIAYILEDSQAELLIVENLKQWERIRGILKDWKYPVVLIEGEGECFISLAQLIELGKKIPVNQYDDSLRMIQMVETASIIYTSGTTGIPKGSLITHRNIIAEVEGLQEIFPFDSSQIGFLCLPLAHVIARAMQFYQLAQGCQAAYAESIDAIPANLQEVRPHFMAGVPRLFEKSYEKINQRLAQSSSLRKKIFDWGLGVGKTMSESQQKKWKIPWWRYGIHTLARLLVFRKVRRGFGGRMEVLISGGAPLSKAIAQFFHALGMLIIEGYGLTETFAAIALNRLDDFRFGTVGKPLEGVRLKIAEDGEICAKGDTIFAGYLNKKEETEAAFDKEGWFLTGDIGEFTKDGFLRITDRKKDIIVTAGGKNIAPQAIENLLQQNPYIQQAMIHGDGRKFLSALITLNWEVIEEYAKQQQIAYRSQRDLANDPKIVALVQKEVDKCNQTLSSFENIRKFAILEGTFSVESGELTPTMKVKRKFVGNKYKNILDRFYGEGSS